MFLSRSAQRFLEEQAHNFTDACLEEAGETAARRQRQLAEVEAVLAAPPAACAESLQAFDELCNF